MNLKKLELFGFKSFMRKLDIHFSDGITVIVGPNGCGKTNVTDALRWVLGESNARMLRGNRMEDLIFNGTRDYKPLNVAEVSLTVDNSSGILPIEYSEVTVSRRVFRDGEPEFLINRVPGRLRDIQELFMDTGLGSRAYSVIEREMVEMVLADQPEKRRELLEEAAGIMKYKIRERQAQRKLSATDDDLYRIQDVLREVERQVRSLKRQVGAAKRFQEIRDRLRELEVGIAMVDLERMDREAETARRTLDENQTERDGAASRVAALEADIETSRVASTEADAALSTKQREVDELAEDARRIENENVVKRERRESLLAESRRLAIEREELRGRVEAASTRSAELEETRTRQRESSEELGNRLREEEEGLSRVESNLESRKMALSKAREVLEAASQEVGRLQAELANLETHGEHISDREAVLNEEIGEIETIRSARDIELAQARDASEASERELAELDRQLEERRRDVMDVERERETLREEESKHAVSLESARSALEMLRGLQESHEGYGQGARSLLSSGGGLSALADSLHITRPELIQALDAALEAAIQYVVAPSTRAALEGVNSLKRGEGRATLLDLEGFRNARSAPRYEALPTDASILGSARSFLEVSGDLSVVLDELLGNTLVVETLEDAVRLAKRSDTRGYRFVSRDGDWAQHPGIIHGGSRGTSADSRILGRVDRITEFERRLEEEESKRTDAERRAAELTERKRSIEEAIALLTEKRDGVREHRASHDKAIERIGAEISAARVRMDSVRGERDGLEGKRAELAQRRESVEREVAAAEENRTRLEEEWQVRETELVASTDDRDRAQKACHDLRLGEQRAAAELEKLDLELARLAEARRADEAGIVNRTDALGETDQTVGELARQLEEGLSAFAAKTSELEERRRVRDRVAQDRAAVLEKLREVEEERNRWSRLRDQAAELLHENEMNLTKLELAREELTARVEREFEVKLSEPAVREAHLELLHADEETLAEVGREREDLRKHLERMGAVNLVALEQFDRESRRLEFLQTQRDDLEAAREKLRRTIRKINRTARTLFMETLEQVRTNFQQTFGTLFEGGQADIRLAGDEDPLHAPIEIFARPRGKRPSNISLLSSGERSLTAVAFLFAIYLVKPSPFCILDEVDAPLDDANIGRFLGMLKRVAEKTQFVMITHNKKTMEVADYLYGVTMEEPGISKLVSVELGRDDGFDPGVRPEPSPSREAEGELVLEGAG